MHFRGLKKSAGDLSLSDSIDTDGEGNSLSLMDIIFEEDDMLERVSRLEIRQNIRANVDSALSPREAAIIKMRYGLEGRSPLTQREVAKNCDISRSYVSRIEKRALEKLRAVMEE
jgi:RNA polymerase sporulation-specific sigma factor